MKFSALICLLLVSTMTFALRTEAKDNVVIEVAEVIEGLLLGVFEGSFPVKDCITDAEDIGSDLEKIYFFFKEGHTLDHFSEALKYAGDAVGKMPAVIKECKSCTGIIKEVETFASFFANPLIALEKIGKNIIWHHKEITGDIKQAISDWEAQNW